MDKINLIRKFPVFSLTEIFLSHFPIFFPVQWGPCLTWLAKPKINRAFHYILFVQQGYMRVVTATGTNHTNIWNPGHPQFSQAIWHWTSGKDTQHWLSFFLIDIPRDPYALVFHVTRSYRETDVILTSHLYFQEIFVQDLRSGVCPVCYVPVFCLICLLNSAQVFQEQPLAPPPPSLHPYTRPIALGYLKCPSG